MSNPTIDDLPPDPRSALLGLIGSTFAELKRVDEFAVTKNQNTAGIKTDLNRLIHEANSLMTPQTQPQVPVLTPQPVMPQPSLEPVVVQTTVPALEPKPIQEQQPQSNDDPDQLLFNFYRQITPDDINSRLADIDLKLAKILEKLDEFKDKE